jgi:hypothetical protein
MPFISKVPDEKEISKYYIGFPKGVNTVQDQSLVNDKNLIQGENVIIDVDGVKRRPGTTKVFNEASATKVYGSTAYYKKTDGTRQQVRMAHGYLQYREDDDITWTEVTTHSFSNLPTSFVQAGDKLFIYNGTENLRYWDGSTITTYTALDTPTGLTVTATGSAGSTAYSYEVSAFSNTGETLACSAVSITNGNATLSSTNYNALNWDDTTNALGYNVYGRTATGYGRVYLTTVYVSAYNDTGTDTPTTSKLSPEANNTGGIKGKYGIFSNLGRQFVAGVTEGTTYYPTRLYYSGTVQYVDSFVSAEPYGGGWIEIASNDGGEIVDIKPYQSSVLVWKTNGLYKFYFTSTQLPAVLEITRDHGGVSFNGSQAIDNDYVYIANVENRIAVMTVGQQQNYVGDQLRTNELSIFFRNDLKGVNRAYLTNIATFKNGDYFGFTFTNGENTENDRGWVVDTRFGGWTYWTGLPMECTHYSSYDDGNNLYLYGGSNSDGYMIRMFEEDANDNDVAFTSTVGTKAFNLGYFDLEKIFRNPVLWFKYISGGSVDLEIWADGTRKVGTASLSSSASGVGVGADLVGQPLLGDTTSSSVETTANADVPKVVEMMEMCRTLKFYLIDSNKNSNWLFMGIHLQATPLEGKPLKDEYRVQLL